MLERKTGDTYSVWGESDDPNTWVEQNSNTGTTRALKRMDIEKEVDLGDRVGDESSDEEEKKQGASQL